MGTPISFPIIHSFLVTTNLFTISLSPIPSPGLVVSVCAHVCACLLEHAHVGMHMYSVCSYRS